MKNLFLASLFLISFSFLVSAQGGGTISEDCFCYPVYARCLAGPYLPECQEYYDSVERGVACFSQRPDAEDIENWNENHPDRPEECIDCEFGIDENREVLLECPDYYVNNDPEPEPDSCGWTQISSNGRWICTGSCSEGSCNVEKRPGEGNEPFDSESDSWCGCQAEEVFGCEIINTGNSVSCTGSCEDGSECSWEIAEDENGNSDVQCGCAFNGKKRSVSFDVVSDSYRPAPQPMDSYAVIGALGILGILALSYFTKRK